MPQDMRVPLVLTHLLPSCTTQVSYDPKNLLQVFFCSGMSLALISRFLFGQLRFLSLTIDIMYYIPY